jgi:hypothetical protein
MNRARFTGFLIAVVLAVMPAVELKGGLPTIPPPSRMYSTG